MNNIKKTVVISSIFIVVILLIYNISLGKEIITDKKLKKDKNNNFISFLIESGEKTGTYTESTSNIWPEGYIFNEKLSKCQNGSELTYDEENKKVKVSAIKSDKCYVYFDAPLYHETCNDTTLACTIAKKYTAQGESHLYYHDGTITATEANADTGVNIGDVIDASDGSYRYSGSGRMINNCICFGTDETTCQGDNLYRIIGVFEVPIIDENGNITNNTERRVKLIRGNIASSALLGEEGDYYSDTTYSWNNANYDLANAEKGKSNLWGYSALNKTNLNKNFITYLNNINPKWSNMIGDAIWYIGGVTTPNGRTKGAKVAHNSELGENKITSAPYEPIIAKIGLMYLSDYYYAALPIYWSYPGSNSDATKDYRAAKSSNWIYSGYAEWTISPYANASNSAFSVDSNGRMIGATVNDASYGVSPVFYLKSSVKYVGGDGSSSNPYIIGM